MYEAVIRQKKLYFSTIKSSDLPKIKTTFLAHSYMMRSSKMGLKSKKKKKKKVSISLQTLTSELYYSENPVKIEHTVPEI